MSDLDDLYQDIILDHHKRPRHYRLLRPATHEAEGHNPLCGDEMRLTLRVVDGKVAEVGFEAEGCAISRASASLMAAAVAGKPLGEVAAIRERALGLLTAPAGSPAPELDEVGDLAALAGVRRFPARIKCATLGWHALDAALKGSGSATTEGAARDAGGPA